MDPSDKTPNQSSDVVMEALHETNASLSTYSQDFFKNQQIQAVTQALLTNLTDMSETGKTAQNEAWLSYTLASEEVVSRTLAGRGEAASEQATLSAMLHKAMLYKTIGDAIHYFGELQKAEEYAYQSITPYDEGIDEVIHGVIDEFLETTGLTFEGVTSYVLAGTEAEVNERIARGEAPPEDTDESREHLSESIVNMQPALEEEIRNGADLQVVLGEVYQLCEENGEDPVPIFKELGFPEVIV